MSNLLPKGYALHALDVTGRKPRRGCRGIAGMLLRRVYSLFLRGTARERQELCCRPGDCYRYVTYHRASQQAHQRSAPQRASNQYLEDSYRPAHCLRHPAYRVLRRHDLRAVSAARMVVREDSKGDRSAYGRTGYFRSTQVYEITVCRWKLSSTWKARQGTICGLVLQHQRISRLF